MTRITVEVVPLHAQDNPGPFRAGMALVKLDGHLIARLRTTEGIEIEVGKPTITTTMDHGMRPAEAGR